MVITYDANDWIDWLEREMRNRRRNSEAWLKNGHMQPCDAAPYIDVPQSLLQHLLDVHRPREALRPLENAPQPLQANWTREAAGLPPVHEVIGRIKGPRDL